MPLRQGREDGRPVPELPESANSACVHTGERKFKRREEGTESDANRNSRLPLAAAPLSLVEAPPVRMQNEIRQDQVAGYRGV